MEPVEVARLVLADHPHLDRLWWRVDSADEGVIFSSVEPVERGWTLLERPASEEEKCEREDYRDVVDPS